MITVICQQCSTNYSVKAYRATITKYCSRRCLALAARQELTSICGICSKSFTHIASRANKAKYCSTQCYHKAQQKKGTVQFECHHCHSKFLGSPSDVGKRKYCSRACTQKSSISTWKPTFATVRKQMIARGMLKHCERCALSEPIEILGVHHKDRNPKNNCLSNLEVLCPNCHSIEHMKHTPHGFKE